MPAFRSISLSLALGALPLWGYGLGVSSGGTFMTYSFNTLNVSSGDKAAPRSGIARFGHEVALLLGFLALVFWSLALISYAPTDAAWSTSGLARIGDASGTR